LEEGKGGLEREKKKTKISKKRWVHGKERCSRCTKKGEATKKLLASEGGSTVY